MKVRWIILENFRNYAQSEFVCGESVNVFLGENGAGKTNAVEAIAYLCLTRSFYATGERTVVQVGQGAFRVAGEMVSDRGTTFRVSVKFDVGTSEKTFHVNSVAVGSLMSIIGKFPLVVVSPEHHNVTFGAPADRRKFLDLVIAQASPVYVDDLVEYRSALRQRNKLLLAAKLSGSDPSDTLESWEKALVVRGVHVMQRRRQFLEEFQPILLRAYAGIAGNREEPGVQYQSSVTMTGKEDTDGLRRAFERAMDEARAGELRTGTTLVGPHRDELLFTLDGLELRKFASQGQHKTFLIALKLAEFEYLKTQCRETPVLILDDVFSELDEGRASRLFGAVHRIGQIFITTTDHRVFPDGVLSAADNRVFYIKQGSVVNAEA